MLKRISIGAVAGALLLSAATVASAQAASHDGTCNGQYGGNGELCLYYNSNQAGAIHDFAADVSNFAGYTFIGPGAGAGTGVKNNAASVTNKNGLRSATVYYNSNYVGASDYVAAWTSMNLSATYNNNASFRFNV